MSNLSQLTLLPQRKLRSRRHTCQNVITRLHGLLVVDKPGQPFTSAPAHTGVTVAAAAQPMHQRFELSFTDRLPTSHDVVQMVRRWSGQRQIGHTGTLDPMASGVLVLCLGNATRLVEYYQGQPKQYYAEIVLGSATDTYDATGEMCATAPIPSLEISHIEAALEQFRGPFCRHRRPILR